MSEQGTQHHGKEIDRIFLKDTTASRDLDPRCSGDTVTVHLQYNSSAACVEGEEWKLLTSVIKKSSPALHKGLQQ